MGVVRTVGDLIEALKPLPPGARVWTGCLPGREYVEVEEYDAEHDVVRIVGPCDGDEVSDERVREMPEER